MKTSSLPNVSFNLKNMTLTKFNITPDQRKELCKRYAVLSIEEMDYDDMKEILVDKICEELDKYSTPQLVQHIIDYNSEETCERLVKECTLEVDYS